MKDDTLVDLIRESRRECVYTPVSALEQFGTVMNFACRYGNIGVISALLSDGYDPNTTIGTDKWVALMDAVICGHDQAAKLLIDGGANVNATTTSGYTPLMFAAKSGRTNVLPLLIQSGAEIDKVGGLGWTALMIAVIFSKEEVIRVLLDEGADLTKVTQGGCALELAESGRNPRIIQMLHEVTSDEFQTRIHFVTLFPNYDNTILGTSNKT